MASTKQNEKAGDRVIAGLGGSLPQAAGAQTRRRGERRLA